MPKAECEAKAFAWRILKPRVPVTREIGCDELTRVMQKALEEVNAAGGRAQDELKRLSGQNASG
jgi:hypothetical protein